MILSDYQAFEGRHYETGTVQNALAYQGVIAPHTHAPISEALLLGISGGVTVGYFTFEYEGYPPHISLLTRNTFDPLETLFERLAIPRDVQQTSSDDKARENLHEALADKKAPLVWVDMFSLPHNGFHYDENNWAVIPVVVYGLDDENAYIADRAGAPIIVDAGTLHTARARIKKYKFRVMTLDTPDWERLPAAVSNGIWQCIRLYTEAPPKGKRDSFGLAALQHWAKMLTNTRNKQSWLRYFSPGNRLWMALAGDGTQAGIYQAINLGEGNAAERGMYADFLQEAATILQKPTLSEAAELFRKSEAEWAKLAELTLPEDVAKLNEAKTLLARKRTAFIEQGSAALDEIVQINTRLESIQHDVSESFPMTEDEVTAFFERLAQQVLVVHDCEQAAIECVQSVMM